MDTTTETRTHIVIASEIPNDLAAKLIAQLALTEVAVGGNDGMYDVLVLGEGMDGVTLSAEAYDTFVTDNAPKIATVVEQIPDLVLKAAREALGLKGRDTSDSKAAKIRELIDTTPRTASEIAKQVGVSYTTAHQVIAKIPGIKKTLLDNGNVSGRVGYYIPGE